MQRILDAAAREFARHGFAATRVRDIVEGAGVNLAAVSYHFGGKEGLYRATLAMLARRAHDDMPGDSPELRARPPQEQLRDASGPQWRRLLEIVSALLGPRASEEDVSLASLSIAGQWVFFLFGRRMFEAQFPDLARKPSLVDQLADHIAAFSIAAIRARRSQLEQEQAHHTRARPARTRSAKEAETGQ